jgi:hypothetical protein
MKSVKPNLRPCSLVESVPTCGYGHESFPDVFSKILRDRVPACDTGQVKRASVSVHIDDTSRHYTTAAGERRSTRCILLRRSYRDENGKPRNETLANLSALPDNAIAALRLALKGAALVDAESAFDVERSVPHGNAAAAHVMAGKLGLRALLGPPCPQRDIAYALIMSQAVRPKSKLSTVRWWNSGDTTLAADLGIADAGTDDVYAAMDWLLTQKDTRRNSPAGTCARAGSRCMTCPPRGWKARSASWPRSGIPATASAGERRSSTDC